MRIVVLVAAFALSGCATTFDLTYAVTDLRHYNETRDERKGTGTSETRVEYELRNDTASLQCVERTRQLERSQMVTRRYKRRGGFTSGTYKGFMVIDALIGGIIGGAILASCTGDEGPSCMNLLWAAPFALDLGYAAIRSATAKEPVLIGKRRATENIVSSDEPDYERLVSCAQVALRLGDYVDGAAASDQLQSSAVETTPDGRIALSEGLVESWLARPRDTLYVKTPENTAVPVKFNRCKLLRGLLPQLPPRLIGQLSAQCPAPKPQR